MNGSTSKKTLKTSFRASPRSLRPLYTGGPVVLTQDGRWLITTMGEEVLITELASGLPVARVRGDTTAITALAISYHTSPPTLLTAHLSNSIRYYPLPSAPPAHQSKPPLLQYTRHLSKASSALILLLSTSPDSTLFASGSSDGIVKVWDAAGGYVTHIFRGHGGPVSALRFSFPTPSQDGNGHQRMELFTGSTDGRVRVFDLKDAGSRVVGAGAGGAKAKAVLEGHVSTVRGVDVSDDGRWAVSGGRDKVVLVWDLGDQGDKKGKGKEKGKGKAKGEGDAPKVVQTIIAQEQVEALGLLKGEDGRLRCFTGGDKGLVRVWDVLKGEEVGRMRGVEGVDEDEDDEEVEEDEQRGVINVLHDPSTSSLVSIHADQNIIFHSLTTLSPTRQVVGFNDEIIDACFLTSPSLPSSSTSPHTHLALATNSDLIRIYSTSTFDARLLSGHADMVLCLDKSTDHKWLVSGSKDRTARIWAPAPDEEGQWRCVAICEGHAESVGAVAFSRKSETGARFLVTASQDRTIKLWDLSTLDASAATPAKPKSLVTLRAHEKDINSLDLAPNDKFLASGSQDKLVKIYAVDYADASGKAGASGSVKLLGTCKGHRRGVWSVRFSRTDRVVASGAADRSVKLWSLDDFSCLKTFEGHTNSVLRVDFLSAGQQLVTTSSDGLVKLWNIRDEECVKTLDNHEDKVWALAVSADEKTIVSAGADSVATFWEDSTEADQNEKNEALIKSVQSEQDFTNYVALKDYRRAILLALAMSQPGRLLSLFTAVLASGTADDGEDKPHSYTGSPEVDSVIATLPGLDLIRLLQHVRNWNANARTSPIAQAILHTILRLRTPDEILQAFERSSRNPVQQDAAQEDKEVENGVEVEEPPKKKSKGEEKVGLRELLDGLIPYSERHFARVDRLVQDSYALDYVLGEMDGGVLGGGGGLGNGHGNGMEVDL